MVDVRVVAAVAVQPLPDWVTVTVKLPAADVLNDDALEPLDHA